MLRSIASQLLLLAVPGIAFAQAPAPSATASAPTFEVASIRQNLSPGGRSHIWSSAKEGKFKTENVSLKALLQFAFDTPDTQIVGGPDALLNEKFDIEAKSDPSVDAQLASLTNEEGARLKRRMLQALFAERFKLVTHPETRQLPIYTLVVAKKGPLLTESKNGDRFYNENISHIDDHAVTAEVLAQQLARKLGHPVVDKTGLTGHYDLILKWTPDGAPVTDDSPPSIFTAIEEQLGLKLESTKGPVDVLVIDHVESPSEN